MLADAARGSSPILVQVGSLRMDFHLWRLLSGVLEFHGLRFVDVDIHLERDAQGRWSWAEPPAAGAVPATGSDVQVRIDSARFKNMQIAYRDTRSGRSWAVNVARLAVTGLGGRRPLRLDAHGPLEGGSFDVSLRLNPPSPAGGTDASRTLSFRGAAWGGRIQGAGTLASSGTAAAIDATLSATFTDMAGLSAAAGRDLSFLGPLQASGRLRHSAGDLGLAGLDVKMGDDDGAWVHVSGSVGDLLAVRDVLLAARFGSADVRPLGKLLGRELSGIGPWEGSATIIGDRNGDVDVEALNLSGGIGGPVEITLDGVVEDILAFPVLDASLRMHARDLAAVGETVGVSLPPVGPVASVARLGNHGGTVGMTDLEVTVGAPEASWAEFTGHVHDALAWRGIQIGGDLLVADLGWLGRFLEVPVPDLGPLRGSVLLGDADGTLGLDRFRIERLPDPLRVLITGSVGDLRRLDEVDIATELSARDLEVLGRAFGTRLAPVGPMEFSGRVVGSKERVVGRDLAFDIGRTRVVAHAEASFIPGLRPRVSAFVHSPLLHLDDMGIGVHGEAAVADGHATLPIHLLREVDADVQVRVEQAMGRRGPAVDEAEVAVRLEDGVLQVQDTTLRLPQGNISVEGGVDARPSVPSVWLVAGAAGVELEGVVAQFTEERLLSGVLDADVDLRSTGASVRQLLSDLEGEVLLVVEGGSTASKFSRVFAKDMGRALLSENWRGDVQSINCIIGDFRIDYGVATSRTLVLDSADLTIVGDGTIDLGSNTLAVSLTPKLWDPGMFSMVARVEVTGSLTDPVYTPLKSSAVASAFRHFLDSTSRPFRAVLAREPPRLPRTGPCASALRRAR